MDNESWMPRAEEPMEEYLKSERYRKLSTGIVFSDFTGQEEANYAFWRQLTPAQRLELHTIMVSTLYADTIKMNPDQSPLEIIFTEAYI